MAYPYKDVYEDFKKFVKNLTDFDNVVMAYEKGYITFQEFLKAALERDEQTIANRIRAEIEEERRGKLAC